MIYDDNLHKCNLYVPPNEMNQPSTGLYINSVTEIKIQHFYDETII